MIIDCISDLHGHYPTLEGGDLLIVAGDLTASDKPHEMIEFGLWINEQRYKRKIIISGNHDNMIQTTPRIFEGLPDFVMTYLCDSGTEFEYEEDEPCNFCGEKNKCRRTSICGNPVKKKLKIWGSPWTKRFEGMNPACMAFTVDTDEELAEKWGLIPEDTDILITHCPPWGMMDEIRPDPYSHWEHTGSKSLLDKWINLDAKIHIFGHIHEGYGIVEDKGTYYINASHVNERYEPVNKPIRIEL